MPHSTPALTAILQASALWILGFVIQHFSLEHGFTPVKEFQDAYKANKTEVFVQDLVDNPRIAGTNMTITNVTLSAGSEPSDDQDFLFSELPKNIPAIILTAFLRYWWLIWLERLLPARPRSRRDTSTSDPSAIHLDDKGEDDSREEEIIKKWVEAGKVRRSSLSWCNTFLKWMLDLSLGNLWDTLLDELVVQPVIQWTLPWNMASPSSLAFRFFFNLMSPMHLVTLISFILLPAQKRLVFEAGVGVAFSIFFGAFLHVIVPWAMSKQLVQDIMRNATEAEMMGSGNETLAREVNGTDEL